MASSFDWDGGEEKARERRIVERRARVEERLRKQHDQRAKQGEGLDAQPSGSESAILGARGHAQAAASAEAVRAVLSEQRAAAEGVRTGAETRSEAHRAACDAEEAALREAVASEAEAARRENRAIDLEWEQLGVVAAAGPQALAGGIARVQDHCGRVLDSKEGVLGEVRALLQRRDYHYVKLLRTQAEESDALIASMHSQHGTLRAEQERQLEAVEEAYLQERAEMLATHKAELNALLEKRSAAEAQFMEGYLGACEQYENELERLRVEGLGEHGTLKRKLEAEVAALEAHLDSSKAALALNADKLDYNHRVLVERERESKEALMQQKRRITRQWEVLNRLRKRHAAAEARAAADNARLSDEYQHVTRAFNHLQTKFRHFKAADLNRFDKVREMKEEELGELLGQLQEAEAFITSFVVGLPLAPAAATAAEAAGAGCDASPNSGGASTGAGLELVGQGVELDPRAVAAAAAAAGWAPGEMPAEVVALSAAAAGQHTQLIAAYRGGQGSGGVAEQEAPGSALALDALAEAELHASADSGALSLLLGGAGGTRLQSGALQQLLARVPAGPGGGSRLTAEAVARCLGLQHSTTVAALERAFAGAGSAGDSLAATIQPRLPAEEGGTQGGASHAADGIFASSAPTFSATQVEAGLACLLSQLLASTSGGGSSGSAFATASPPASPPPQPTGKQYWRSRVEAALPGDVLRAWELLEAQASRQFATLQGRSGAAQEVLALRAENERLKSTLGELLSSPLNRELQLPPTLLLR